VLGTIFDHGRFWFLRHGQTGANAQDLIAGATDVPLSDAGHEQARQVALRIAGLGPAALWVSPMIRTRQTAAAIQTLLPGLPLHLLPGIAERNWGVWEGRPRAVLRRDLRPQGGEGPDEFRRRVLDGLASIAPPHPVLIVAHSGTAREIFARLGLPVERPANCDLLEFGREANGHWIVTKR